MAGTGIIRRVDELGRIVLPKEIRRQLHIVESDPIEIEVVSGGIMLRKYCPDDKIRAEILFLTKLVTDENNLSDQTTQKLRQHLTDMLRILDQN